ncbi:hypothetical protein EI94DRAFT_1700497 [Lactarius quietus]|nr:hypothetical protein EI94DRAFT_1700497 [Lactarius quietus]
MYSTGNVDLGNQRSDDALKTKDECPDIGPQSHLTLAIGFSMRARKATYGNSDQSSGERTSAEDDPEDYPGPEEKFSQTFHQPTNTCCSRRPLPPHFFLREGPNMSLLCDRETGEELREHVHEPGGGTELGSGVDVDLFGIALSSMSTSTFAHDSRMDRSLSDDPTLLELIRVSNVIMARCKAVSRGRMAGPEPKKSNTWNSSSVQEEADGLGRIHGLCPFGYRMDDSRKKILLNTSGEFSKLTAIRRCRTSLRHDFKPARAMNAGGIPASVAVIQKRILPNFKVANGAERGTGRTLLVLPSESFVEEDNGRDETHTLAISYAHQDSHVSRHRCKRSVFLTPEQGSPSLPPTTCTYGCYLIYQLHILLGTTSHG